MSSLARGSSAADCFTHNCGRIGRRAVGGPGDIAVGAHENELGFVSAAAVGKAVADDFQRHAEPARRLFKRRRGLTVAIEREQREIRAELLEYTASGGQKLRRQMMAGARFERV